MADTEVRIEIKGPIGETNDFFNYPLKDIREVVLDLKNMTFINSIGVKNWVVWTLRVPPDCTVRLQNAPYVMISQASMVKGFATFPKFKVESFKAPFSCSSCGHESETSLEMGKDFEYCKEGQKSWFKIPEIKCKKCGAEMEPDFIEEKSFKFLAPDQS